MSHDLRDAAAHARAELGYVDFLRARYDRAKRWLADAVHFANGSPSVVIKALTYLGAVESDRASYQRATDVLAQALDASRSADDPRGQALALALLGRVSLLTGALEAAAGQLDASIELASRDRWLAFLPFPQALRGEIQLARADVTGAAERFQHAFARACQIGDPCWEGFAARGLALAAEACGDSGRAFALLDEARARCNRLGEPYTWLDAYILDAMCELGVRYSSPAVKERIEELRVLATRTGMKALAERSAQHASALAGSCPAGLPRRLLPRRRSHLTDAGVGWTARTVGPRSTAPTGPARPFRQACGTGSGRRSMQAGMRGAYDLSWATI